MSKLSKLLRSPGDFIGDSVLGNTFAGLFPRRMARCEQAVIASLTGDVQRGNPTDQVAFLFGFNEWKRGIMSVYLPGRRLVFVSRRARLEMLAPALDQVPDASFYVWSYADQSGLADYVRGRGVPLVRVEDGFLRSVALGATHALPYSLCFDATGLYFDSGQPSDLENLLNTFDFAGSPALLVRAERLMARLRELSISKYNPVARRDAKSLYGEKTRTRILVIGQVEDDASIRKGVIGTFTNNDLVRLARAENPSAEIFYKPHPDVLGGYRHQVSLPSEVAGICTVLTQPLALCDAFETVDRVYTLTSLAGFEALLRGIPVTCVGAPFYAGWGLTDDRQGTGRRSRRLSITELFAGAYILYPRYVDPDNRCPIEADDAVELLAARRGAVLAAPEPGQPAFRKPSPAQV